MLLTGSILDRAPGRKYTQALRFAELSLRSPLPRPATLASWRAGLPDDFVLALRAPRSAVVSQLGPLRTDPGLETALEWLHGAADALRVRAVVLPTPADFTPGARSRELLASYVQKLSRGNGGDPAGRLIVWAPSGAWESDEIQAVAEPLGIVPAFDPLQAERPRGAVVYGQLRALGHRSSFSHAALEDALAVIESAETGEALISIDSPRAFEVAKRLQKIVAEREGLPVPEGTADDTDSDDDESDDEDQNEDELDEEDEQDDDA